MVFAIHWHESAMLYTCFPHPKPPSQFPPHPIPQGCPSALTLSALFHSSNQDWCCYSVSPVWLFETHVWDSHHSLRLHLFLELAQTCVHWVSHAIQPSSLFCRPLLLLPTIFPSIRVFSDESVIRIRQPKYWSFSFSINVSNEYSGLISFKTSLISLQSKGLSSNTTVQKHQFFGAQPSLRSNSYIHMWLLENSRLHFILSPPLDWENVILFFLLTSGTDSVLNMW